MTSLGHILTGTAVFIAGRRGMDKQNPESRKSGRALSVACLFCAAVPDFDLFIGFLSGAYIHRGATHSIVFCLFLGFVSAALLCKVYPALPQWRTYLMCLISAQSHLLIDFFGADTYPPFGIPVFWPFTTRYFIAPIALFPTSMRGSFELVFSGHNVITGIVELCFGGLLCLAAFVFSGQKKENQN